jgi:GNAT superfamily N-acetyltransferase
VLDPGPLSLELARFAVRAATPDDDAATAAIEVRSWRSTYRGILPDPVLARLDIVERTRSRRRTLLDDDGVHLVAIDTTRRAVVGFCDAGPSRRSGASVGEVYTIYLEHHAKRYGLGRDMFAQVFAWLRARRMASLIVWVLEDNHHARRFYEALGGRAAHRIRSIVDGYPVIEQAYVWDPLPDVSATRP